MSLLMSGAICVVHNWCGVCVWMSVLGVRVGMNLNAGLDISRVYGRVHFNHAYEGERQVQQGKGEKRNRVNWGL